MKIGIIGVGFVGGAMKKVFEEKNIEVFAYDKYKKYDAIEEVCKSDIIFLCLPTLFIEECGYDKKPIYETCDYLEEMQYKGSVVVKSTVEPGTVKKLNKRYSFDIYHNPEFLTARTAYEDFKNQTHIVIGVDLKKESLNVYNFYKKHWPNAKISICKTEESEAMKLFCNNFYSMKIMIFNEFYDLCKKQNLDYNIITELMLKNEWINKMHTEVPGPDGKLGYGGACFIKDTNALLEHTKRIGSLNSILNSCIKERNLLREDQTNIIKINGVK